MLGGKHGPLYFTTNEIYHIKVCYYENIDKTVIIVTHINSGRQEFMDDADTKIRFRYFDGTGSKNYSNMTKDNTLILKKSSAHDYFSNISIRKIYFWRLSPLEMFHARKAIVKNPIPEIDDSIETDYCYSPFIRKATNA